MSESELSPGEQLYRISEQTNGDGTVSVEVNQWEKRGDKVGVELILPTGDTFEETMRWPEYDDEQYKFIRLLRAASLDPVGADALEGEYVPAERVGDRGWTTAVEPQPGRWERMKAKFAGAELPNSEGTDAPEEESFLFFLTAGVIIIPLVGLFEPFTSNRDSFSRGMSTTVWVLAIWALVLATIGVFVL